MNRQVIHDAMHLRAYEFLQIQAELGVSFQKGSHECEEDFRKRVLTEVDRAGNIRSLEQLLTQ